VFVKSGSWAPALQSWLLHVAFVSLVFCAAAAGQERQVEATWLHRSVPELKEAKVAFATPSCHYTPIFGEGDSQSKILRSVSRFGQATLDSQGSCADSQYAREEELYFVLEGQGVLHYGEQALPLRANDFTYVAPGLKHSVANSSQQPLRVLVMGFKVPASKSIRPAEAPLKIVNLQDVKEETVQGHPDSVLYKLMIGPRTGKRDAIDEAYVVTSLFLMDFAPGGTNFPHHHETAEEIYLVLDGQGDMVAGSGNDGIEGRYPAKAGDAYYFRANCTVGFYNENKPEAQAHILAVRSWIPLPKDDD
jgi:mannose-6-phosphate isomerase-like protein (cupin superfamily)